MENPPKEEEEARKRCWRKRGCQLSGVCRRDAGNPSELDSASGWAEKRSLARQTWREEPEGLAWKGTVPWR